MFSHASRDIRVVVHGDDFLILASQADIDWFVTEVKKEFEIKVSMIGPDTDRAKTLKILNRVITWDEEGILIEGDQRHPELLLDTLGMSDKVKAAPTPVEQGGKEQDDRDLDEKQATIYRSCTARANFMTQDRSDIQFSVKELSHRMARPHD